MGSHFGSRAFRFSPFALALVLLAANRLGGQAARPAGNQAGTAAAPISQASQPNSSSPQPAGIPLLKVTSHLVTIDVVVTDRHGHVVPDLTAKDFQVFEQVPAKKGQREQKISQFEFVTQKSAAVAGPAGPKFPAGVYTNLVSA